MQMRGVGTEKHLEVKEARDNTQLKTFTRWWAAELAGHHTLAEGSLAKALASGVPGIVLLEQLTSTPFKSYHAEPGDSRIKIIENQHIFLERVKELGIQLTNISAEDLADGKQTLVLGLTWKLITHFSGGMLGEAGGIELLGWLRRNIASVAPSVEVTSWNDSLADGLVLCALLHAYDPTAIPNLASLQPANAASNLELAFTVAQERFGCPRLLDPSDLMMGAGGGGDEEAVDVRSLMTYVVKLRQALRRHAHQSIADAAKAIDALELEASELAQWARAAVRKLEAEQVKLGDRDAVASSPEERKARVEMAERMYDELATAFRAGEKATKLSVRSGISERSDEAKRTLTAAARTTFDHGEALDGVGGGGRSEAETAGARVAAMLSLIDDAFRSLEEAEQAYESSLLNILTHKRTDLLLAQAEADGSELTQWASAQAAMMSGASAGVSAADAKDVPIASLLAASAALLAFASESEQRAQAVAAVDSSLQEVAKRRAEEGREAADVAGWRGVLDAEWSRSVAAASELRRRVGVASKWQAEQARVLSRQWAEGEAALARCLPEDAELIRPEKLEEGPLSCLVM